ncbi:MAG TPA: NAD(P)-binding domain-containing protein [Fodinibius sp.]|nr:NAD(P)-binding domain-containing protein [Fodinibius sp.]
MPITKQTIAIIGAGGKMGSAIAKGIAGGNYRLLLFDKAPDRLQPLKEEINAIHSNPDLVDLDCAHDCSWEADIIVLAVPRDQEKEIADNIREVATQKVVVSIVRLSDEGPSRVKSEAGTDAVERLQQWLPYSKIVKVFDSTSSTDFKPPVTDGKQEEVLIAGDDEDALQTVTELMETAGFNPIITGDPSTMGTRDNI